MNLLGKITKTQLLLVLITVSFLGSLSLLYVKASDTAAGTDYTITVTYREPETVTPEAPALIDLNTATLEELQTLSGIGPAMAQRIIDYRTEHGPFACVEDILNVTGIGNATLDKFRSHVTVSQKTVSEPSVPEQEPEPEAGEPSESAEDSAPAEGTEAAPAQSENNSGDVVLEEPEEQREPGRPEQDPDGEAEVSALIDLNTATMEELQTLNGIGEVLARQIIDYRTVNGPFTCVDDLINVKGIGEATLNKFRDHVTVLAQSGVEDNAAEEQKEDTAVDEPRSSDLIDINTATLEELQTLNGIGEVLAQRIIDYRIENGLFTCVEDLLNVKGIGEATLKKFREQVTVLPQTDPKPTDETTTAEEDPNENTGR